MSIEPRFYQLVAQKNAEAAIKRGLDPLIVMPTGSGKTNVFAWMLDEILDGRRALVVSHLSELVDQSMARIGSLARNIRSVGPVQGGRNQGNKAQVVAATMQTLTKPGRFLDVIEHGPIDIVIIDEAHRVMSMSYRRLIHMLRLHNKDVRFAGFTATPNRTDGQPLWWTFSTVGYSASIDAITKQGYLVPIDEWPVKLKASIAGISTRGGDLAAGEVSRRLDNYTVNDQVFGTWWHTSRHRQTIGFTSTIAHAESLARYFRSQGIDAAAMSHKTRRYEELVWDEGGMLTAMRKGNLQVIFNAYKLVEGVDLPMVSSILWVRPTISPLVMAQGGGRGCRLYDGKENCWFLDFRPTSDKRLTTFDDVRYGWGDPLYGPAQPQPMTFELPVNGRWNE